MDPPKDFSLHHRSYGWEWKRPSIPWWVHMTYLDKLRYGEWGEISTPEYETQFPHFFPRKTSHNFFALFRQVDCAGSLSSKSYTCLHNCFIRHRSRINWHLGSHSFALKCQNAHRPKTNGRRSRNIIWLYNIICTIRLNSLDTVLDYWRFSSC